MAGVSWLWSNVFTYLEKFFHFFSKKHQVFVLKKINNNRTTIKAFEKKKD
jgi:hypothetical protein